MNKSMSTEPNRDEILTAAANGNAAALEFLRAFARRAHWVDDLRDEPLAHTCHDTIAEMEAEWLLVLTANPFLLANKASLVPAMVLALNAWIDSENWQKPVDGPEQVRHRAQVSVIKGQWHEVVWLVAWLTGGWEKMHDVSAKYRSYDFEPVNEPQRRGDAEIQVCFGCDSILEGYQKYAIEGHLWCSQKCASQCLSASAVNLNGKEPNGLPGK